MVRARSVSLLLRHLARRAADRSSSTCATATAFNPQRTVFRVGTVVGSYTAIQGRCFVGGLGDRRFEACTTFRRGLSQTPPSEVGGGGKESPPSPSAKSAQKAQETTDAADEAVFDDPRAAILDAALDHVETHGFSTTALAAGAKDCGFHSVATGMFPKGGADLIYHVMAKALQEVKHLNAENDDGDKEDNDALEGVEDGVEEVVVGSGGDTEADKLRRGMKAALSTVAQYRNHWARAIAVGALPQNAATTATALAVLADELAFLAGDRSTDLAWYGKRGTIAWIYASTELYMLTDKSEGMEDTWSYLDRRLADYETMASSPENVGDVVTGVGTVATSLSSAAVSLAGPFVKQASKQVPGAETLAQSAPGLASMVSQALSFVMARPPKEQANTSEIESAPQGQHVPTYPGAPERDPWSDAPGSSSLKRTANFEKELRGEEEELFGDSEKVRKEDSRK